MRRKKEEITEEKFQTLLHDIELLNINNELTDAAIVLEGGAFRGFYQEGVLDCLLKNGFSFKGVFGVSAGALNGVNYYTGQSGRSAHINLRYRHDSEYIGITAFLKSQRHSIINLDYAFRELENIPTLNMEKLLHGDGELYAVATKMEDGKAVYFRNDRDDFLKCVKASATLPYISRSILIDGNHYMDGGCADRIPYEFAKQCGYKKIIVLRTRNREFRCRPNFEKRYRYTKRMYARYPEFAYNLAKTDENYNALCDELIKLEKNKEVFVIAPSREIDIKLLEGDLDKLKELYVLGYVDCLAALDSLKEYLKS